MESIPHYIGNSDEAKWNAYQRQLQAFFQTTPENKEERWNTPFAPWCGAEYWSENRNDPRILFVGTAVGAERHTPDIYWRTPFPDWQEIAKSPTSLRDTTSRYMSQRVIPRNPFRHPFWMVPFFIAGAISPRDIDESEIFSRVAWSNFYKISFVQGNEEPWRYEVPIPTRCLSRAQECLCTDCFSVRHLTDEIAILNPDIVLLGLGERWNRFAPYLGFTGNERFPFDITEMLRAIAPNIKIALVTAHFSMWRDNCENGLLALRIRMASSS